MLCKCYVLVYPVSQEYYWKSCSQCGITNHQRADTRNCIWGSCRYCRELESPVRPALTQRERLHPPRFITLSSRLPPFLRVVVLIPVVFRGAAPLKHLGKKCARRAERAERGGKRGKRGGDCEMTGNHAGDLRKTDRLDACRGTWWAVACVVRCSLLCSVLTLTSLLGWGDFIRSSRAAEVYFSTISPSRSLRDPVRWTPLVVHFFKFIFLGGEEYENKPFQHSSAPAYLWTLSDPPACQPLGGARTPNARQNPSMICYRWWAKCGCVCVFASLIAGIRGQRLRWENASSAKIGGSLPSTATLSYCFYCWSVFFGRTRINRKHVSVYSFILCPNTPLCEVKEWKVVHRHASLLRSSPCCLMPVSLPHPSLSGLHLSSGCH